jgi:hypothetical protein
VFHIHFLPHAITTNVENYSNLVCNDVHYAIQNKRPVKLSKIIPLHDNAHPHAAKLMKATLATIGWYVVNYHSHSPDLVPSDFHLSRPMKVRLREQKFQADDELKHGVLN